MARHLRIAIWHNLPFGGAKRALFNHVRGLHALGHEVEIWSPPLPDDAFLPLDRFAKTHVVPLEFSERIPSSYVNAVYNHARRIPRLLAAMRAHSAECARQIETAGFDLLFANTCQYLHTSMVGQYVQRLPKLIYLHDPYRPLYEAMPRLPLAGLAPGAPLKKRLRDLIDLASAREQAREELASAQSYNGILVNSLYSREATLRAFGIDSRVCYLGIDTTNFRPLGLPRERLVVGIGTMGPAKNPRLVVEAIGRITPPRPRLVWTYNMIDEPYSREVIELAERLGVDLHLVRMMPDDDMIRLLNTASVMAYAPRLEPFGLVPLEANACGLPVVAVAEGGVRETMIDGITGLLVGPGSEAMAEGIARILDDSALRDCLSVNASTRAAEFWSLQAANQRLADEIDRFMSALSN